MSILLNAGKIPNKHELLQRREENRPFYLLKGQWDNTTGGCWLALLIHKEQCEWTGLPAAADHGSLLLLPHDLPLTQAHLPQAHFTCPVNLCPRSFQPLCPWPDFDQMQKWSNFRWVLSTRVQLLHRSLGNSSVKTQ